MKTAARLAITMLDPPQDYATLKIPKSDTIMSRLISIQIRITWTENDLKMLMQGIEKAFNEAF